MQLISIKTAQCGHTLCQNLEFIQSWWSKHLWVVLSKRKSSNGKERSHKFRPLKRMRHWHSTNVYFCVPTLRERIRLGTAHSFFAKCDGFHFYEQTLWFGIWSTIKLSVSYSSFPARYSSSLVADMRIRWYITGLHYLPLHHPRAHTYPYILINSALISPVAPWVLTILSQSEHRYKN